MKRRTRIVISLAAVGLGVVLAAAASFLRHRPTRISQPASVMQMMGATRLTVRYNRPSARGRALFGALVPYGAVWNPGADEATTFTTTRPIEFGGHRLDAGRYSVWVIPESTAWTLILSHAWNVYHLPYPAGHDALRLQVTPRTAAYLETLAFSFPEADSLHALLALHWGTTELDVPIGPHRASAPDRPKPLP
ncbi:MAG: DUF2911 domain-containing protein [Gemmatimonadota bacterium]|nr:DUF2911 domain-containing protein [Gemmatimonadota bacterium]MDE3126416.1 DUF2911 domain-containing protein [Gemmatimonadota bacterium]MDE3173805.1 DUF2911 domain-containing protein [Gemmatimonadota bacterium]